MSAKQHSAHQLKPEDSHEAWVEKMRAQYAFDVMIALVRGAGEHLVTQTNEETGPMFAKWTSRLAWGIADEFVGELTRRAEKLAGELRTEAETETEPKSAPVISPPGEGSPYTP